MPPLVSKILGDTLSWARLAKVIGLLGFLLPWMTVSCQSTPLMTATGYQLAVGKVTASNPMTGQAQVFNGNELTSVQIFILVALVVVVAGIALSFWPKAVRRAAPIVLAGALLGAALNGGAMAGALNAVQKELSEEKPEDQWAAMAAAQIKVSTRYGFWVTIGGLLTGAAIAGAAWAGYERIRIPAPRPADSLPSGS